MPPSRLAAVSGRCSGVGFEIHVGQRLTVIVSDNEATAVELFDIPRRLVAPFPAASDHPHRHEVFGTGHGANPTQKH